VRPFYRTLDVRHVDAGSCNGCEQELALAGGPDYDWQRWGIDVVASPRHADALVVTGPVTANMAAALVRDWEAVPEPKVLVALGDCAAGCGVFQAAYASWGGVKAALKPPDLVIGGCPPSPDTIVATLRDWLRRFEQNGSAPSTGRAADIEAP
jgi:Ni,Fe-hydrogenase III small subunit